QMPSGFSNFFYQFLIMWHPDGGFVPNGHLRVGHVDQDLVSVPDQPPFRDVALYLREPNVWRIDDVLPLELGAVLVEAVGYEHRDVVQPRVPRRRSQHDPAVVLDDLEEGLHPLARPYESLLGEDEERVFHVYVLVDVVPAVDGQDPRDRGVGVLTYRFGGELSLPVLAVALTSSRDDVDVL